LKSATEGMDMTLGATAPSRQFQRVHVQTMGRAHMGESSKSSAADDDTGTREPIHQRPRRHRILVQLPGLSDPEHYQGGARTTAKMTFTLVDERWRPRRQRSGSAAEDEVCLGRYATRGEAPYSWSENR